MMRVWGLFFALILFTTAFGQTELTLSPKVYNYTPHQIQFYESARNYTYPVIFSDSIQKKFNISSESKNNFGYTHNIFWAQFEINNLSETENWLIAIENPRIYKVFIYVKNDKKIVFSDFKGLYYISDKSQNLYNFPVFPIKLEKNKKYTVLFKIETNSPIHLPIQVQTLNYFINHEQSNRVWIFILFGFIITTVLYNLIFSILAKEKNNFLLSINIVFVFLYFFFAFGYGYIYFKFIPADFRINFRLIIYCLEIIFSILFTQVFLNLGVHKLLNKIFQAWFLLYSLLLIYVLFKKNDFILINQAIVFTHILILLLVIATSAFSYRKGYKPAIYYLISLIIVFLGSSPYILSILGVNNSFSNFELSNLVSASLFCLFLTIGLNNKLDLVKLEKEKAIKLLADNELLTHEINVRKKAEQKIRIFSKAIEQSANAIIITNPEGIIEYVNPKFNELTGYTSEESVGQKSNILNSGLLPKSFYKSLWETIKQGNIWNGVFNNRKKNGELYWESATISPIFDDDGTIVQYLAIKEDITQQKVNEDALKKSEEQLRKLNATKDKFFSIIAHDLGNSFSALTGFSDILLEDYESLSKDQVVEIISNINTSSKKTYQLFQNLLIWSRSQTGQIPFIPIPLNLRKLIKDNIEILKTQSERKQIQLIAKIPEDIYIVADENMLNTILRNLINNAIKFTDVCGRVIISANKNLSDIEIHISDTGIGMKKETLEKLFRIDVNVSTAGTLNETGTGLGLILCKEFIEAHGGTISVKSEPGLGTDFILNIPIN